MKVNIKKGEIENISHIGTHQLKYLNCLIYPQFEAKASYKRRTTSEWKNNKINTSTDTSKKPRLHKIKTWKRHTRVKLLQILT